MTTALSAPHPPSTSHGESTSRNIARSPTAHAISWRMPRSRASKSWPCMVSAKSRHPLVLHDVLEDQPKKQQRRMSEAFGPSVIGWVDGDERKFDESGQEAPGAGSANTLQRTPALRATRARAIPCRQDPQHAIDRARAATGFRRLGEAKAAPGPSSVARFRALLPILRVGLGPRDPRSLPVCSRCPRKSLSSLRCVCRSRLARRTLGILEILLQS